ncbi:hypothetical protein H4J57_14625 [Colwellia sp. BRX8-7]|jgi:hypothetical protein|uniref:hypothetical protein n=1 Tax=Colwellia sp. BRX8-7 TaxID=2759833 RepID=UPI0015F6E7E3|nr:hypothetical protein [Colwellia sp. BRX8-7]MBA6338426.1 hypothetical protein [Colwellia sp. BRX8-7]
MRAEYFQVNEINMSHGEDFKDSSSIFHLLAAIIALVSAPLLPMVMGWFTLLSN